jgi:hypothetical protein
MNYDAMMKMLSYFLLSVTTLVLPRLIKFLTLTSTCSINNNNNNNNTSYYVSNPTISFGLQLPPFCI